MKGVLENKSSKKVGGNLWALSAHGKETWWLHRNAAEGEESRAQIGLWTERED